MNVLSQVRPPPPLHDLLGVSFEFNTSITALVWDRAFACFGLADGSVAILRANWDGAPTLKPRAGGGAEIAAGTAPPPPPAIFPLHKGGVLALAADPLGGVISGGADGKVQRLHDGDIATIAEKPGKQIRAVAAGRGGRRAYANGRYVDMLGPDARRLTMTGPVTALAYDPAGLHLAVGYEGGVSLEACGIRRNPKFEASAAFFLLAWNNSGEKFAAASAGGDVLRRDRNAADWTIAGGQATALGFSPDGTLITAGADFVHGIGPAGTQSVKNASTPIACHPRLNLVACAGPNGAIFLARPGTPGAMTIRDEGAPATHLAFSPDGEALAFAAADGEAGTVILPGLLFRNGDSK
jgi:WD40 repeat protein